MKTLNNKLFILTAGLIICSLVKAQTQGSFQLPAYSKTVLPNGLTIYLMEQHEVPLINVSVVLPAGAVYDGKQSGISALTALALKHGSKLKKKAQIDEELDYVGASINTNSSKEYATLNAKFAAKDQELVLALMQEILVNPLFDSTEFAKEKKRQITALKQAKESPGRVIEKYFDLLYYGSNVYANPASGFASTMADITIEDVRRFYAGHYIPNGSAIAVAGDFETAAMKTRLTALFSKWKKGEMPGIKYSSVAAPSAANILLINKDDATETTFFIGGPGIAYSSEDKVSLNVINTFFGGRFTSWLNDELRVNTGLTYGARSGFVPFKNAGTFRISTFTATKNTEQAIDKTLEVLDRLHSKGVDMATLTSARNYEKGQFPPDYETQGNLAYLLTQMFWYGFDESYINNFEKNVDQLSVTNANELIKKYFPKNNLQMVLIGKASEIRTIAAKYGKVKEIELKDDVTKL